MYYYFPCDIITLIWMRVYTHRMKGDKIMKKVLLSVISVILCLSLMIPVGVTAFAEAPADDTVIVEDTNTSTGLEDIFANYILD